MKKSYLILFVGLALLIGIFVMGCSSDTDKSPLNLYVTSITCDHYYVNESTTPVKLNINLKCEYTGTTTTNVNGVFIKYYTFTPEDFDGNVLTGIPTEKIKQTLFLEKGSSTSLGWDNFVVDWPSLKNYCDTTGSGSFIYHVHFVGEDSAGNNIEADGYFDFGWGSKPTK